jgi:hypothetical protein
MFGISLRVLRIYMGGVFAFASFMSLLGGTWVILTTFQIQRHKAFLHPSVLILDAVLPATAVFFCVAGWFVWKERPRARGWGIAACLALILQTMLTGSHCWRSVPVAMCVMVAVKVTGLAAFLRHYEMEPEADDPTSEDDPS